jgi:hypothetical protein
MDLDMVSDLNGTGDTSVTVHESGTPPSAPAAPAENTRRAPADLPQKAQSEPVKDETDKPELSLREQISKALKGDTGVEAAPETPASTDTRPRNPDGTFAAAPKEADTAPKPSTIAPPAGVDPQVFASLPAETQAHLARTMEDVQRSQQRFAALEPVEQLIAPRIDAWALNGMQPAQALQQLLALSDFAGRDAAGFIKYIAQNNGVDLEQLVLDMEPGEPEDPRLVALNKEVSDLKASLQGQQQRDQQIAHNARVDQIITFASEKDQQGNLLRPYFDDLGEAVLPYISMVMEQQPGLSPTQVLQEAYDRACWATPAVRTKMQQAADAAGEAERIRKEAERAERARNAGVSVRSGTPSSAASSPDKSELSLRDTIRATMASLS